MRELAEFCGVAPRTVKRWIAAGWLAHETGLHRFGKNWRVDQAVFLTRFPDRVPGGQLNLFPSERSRLAAAQLKRAPIDMFDRAKALIAKETKHRSAPRDARAGGKSARGRQ